MMKMDELINELEVMLEKAWNVPLTGGKCLIDVYQLEQILNEIKNSLPLEIQKAKDIINKEQKIIEGARSASESIIKKAENQAKSIIDDQEIVKFSKERARDIINLAQQREKEIKQSTYDYVDNIVSGVETSLKKYLANIKEVKNIVYDNKTKREKEKEIRGWRVGEREKGEKKVANHTKRVKKSVDTEEIVW